MKRRLLAFTLILIVLTASPLLAQEQEGDYEIITLENIDRLTQIATYGRGSVGSVSRWSPDGETLAVTGTPGIWLFDADDLDAEPELIDVGDSISDVEWSPDGRWIVGSGFDHISLWNIESQTLTKIEGKGAFEFSPDGTELAYTYVAPLTPEAEYVEIEADAEIRILNLETGQTEQVYQLSSNINGIEALEFSPDGQTLYVMWYDSSGVACGSSGRNQDMLAFDLMTSAPVDLTVLKEQLDEPYVYQVAFSPDGQFMAFKIKAYGGVRLWNVLDQQVKFSVDDAYIVGDIFSDDSTHMAVQAAGETKIFDIGTEILNRPTPALSIPYTGTIDLHPNGTRLAINRIVWDAETGERLGAALVNRFQFSENANYLLQIKPTDEVFILDPASGEILTHFTLDSGWLYNTVIFPKSVLFIDQDRNAQLISATTGERLNDFPIMSRYGPRTDVMGTLMLVSNEDSEEILLDTRTGDEIIPPDFQNFFTPFISWDGVIVYYATDDQMHFWNFHTQSLLPFSFEPFEDMTIQFLEDSRFILVNNRLEYSAELWDRQTNTRYSNLPDIQSVDYTWTLDGSAMQLAYLTDDLLTVRDLQSGKDLYQLSLQSPPYVQSLALSEGVLTVNYCDESLYWNIATGETVDPDDLPMPTILRDYDTLSPDEQLGVIEAENQTSLWNVAEDRLVTMLNSGEMVGGLEFTPDGRFLMGRNADQQVVVWGVPRSE